MIPEGLEVAGGKKTAAVVDGSIGFLEDIYDHLLVLCVEIDWNSGYDYGILEVLETPICAVKTWAFWNPQSSRGFNARFKTNDSPRKVDDQCLFGWWYSDVTFGTQNILDDDTVSFPSISYGLCNCSISASFGVKMEKNNHRKLEIFTMKLPDLIMRSWPVKMSKFTSIETIENRNLPLITYQIWVPIPGIPMKSESSHLYVRWICWARPRRLYGHLDRIGWVTGSPSGTGHQSMIIFRISIDNPIFIGLSSVDML